MNGDTVLTAIADCIETVYQQNRWHIDGDIGDTCLFERFDMPHDKRLPADFDQRFWRG